MARIQVNIEQVVALSNRLSSLSTQINQGLTYLQRSINNANGAWSDQVGTNFVNTFNSYVRESQRIASVVSDISRIVSKKANSYSDAYNKAISIMGG